MNLRTILDNTRLNAPNFLDWYKNLRIVLRVEKIAYVLETSPIAPIADAPDADQAAYLKHKADDETTCYIMLASMTSDLQK